MEGLTFSNPVESGTTRSEVSSIEVPVMVPDQNLTPVVEPPAEPVPPVEPPAEPQPPATPVEPVEPVQNLEELEHINNVVPALANMLSESGLIRVVPEDVDPENFNLESFIKTLNYNRGISIQQEYEKGAKSAHTTIQQKLSPLSQKILEYNLINPNADDLDIQSYISAHFEADQLSTLDPAQPASAERIVKEYYKSLGWSPEAIDNKLVDLVKTEKVISEATTVKPLLDKAAESKVSEKLAHAQEIQEYENGMQQALEQKVMSQLQTGKLNGVPLSQQEAQWLAAATMNNEVSVELKGKKVEMGFAEAIVRDAKYNPNSNIENLMMGLLVIAKGPAAIEKFAASKARSDEAQRFRKQQVFSNNKRTTVQKPEPVTKMETGIKFNL